MLFILILHSTTRLSTSLIRMNPYGLEQRRIRAAALPAEETDNERGSNPALGATAAAGNTLIQFPIPSIDLSFVPVECLPRVGLGEESPQPGKQTSPG